MARSARPPLGNSLEVRVESEDILTGRDDSTTKNRGKASFITWTDTRASVTGLEDRTIWGAINCSGIGQFEPSWKFVMCQASGHIIESSVISSEA